MKVTGEGRVKESITRRRRAPPEAHVGTACDLSLKMPGMGGLGVPRGPKWGWGGTGGRLLVPHGLKVGLGGVLGFPQCPL